MLRLWFFIYRQPTLTWHWAEISHHGECELYSRLHLHCGISVEDLLEHPLALLTLESGLHALTSCNQNNPLDASSSPRRITTDVSQLLDQLIEQSVELVGVPAPLMNKEEKIRAINYLNDAGAFLITKSGDKVSKYFGISKYTLYSYVDINK